MTLFDWSNDVISHWRDSERKLADPGDRQPIETVVGVGYRLEATG